jgi:uncharacterized protein YjbI with pentapeptide repeats
MTNDNNKNETIKPDWLQFLNEGNIEEFNKSRERDPNRIIDLSNADFSNKNLKSINFRSANLSGAKFAGANLSNANFSNADLLNANLSNAYLPGAILSNADLSNANLVSSVIIGLKFGDNEKHYPLCQNANFDNAITDDENLSRNFQENKSKSIPAAVKDKKELREKLEGRGYTREIIDRHLSFSSLKM